MKLGLKVSRLVVGFLLVVSLMLIFGAIANENHIVKSALRETLTVGHPVG